MEFMIVILAIAILISYIIHVTPKSLGEELQADRVKLNFLYKAHFTPMVLEYAKLKGYSKTLQDADSAYFGVESERYIPFDVKETIKYVDLEKKLNELKSNMELGCKTLCPPKSRNKKK